jgi:signal transduction histidine kinase
VLGIGSSAARIARLPRPRWTLRLRLTLLYGVVFLVAGAVLLAITYGLVVHSNDTRTVSFNGGKLAQVQTNVPVPLPAQLQPPAKEIAGVLYSQAGPGGSVSNGQLRDYQGKVTSTFRRLNATQQRQLRQLATQAKAVLDHQRTAQLNALLTKSGVALGIMAFISIGLGWLMAGRALRPVRTMSTRARGISERNLHERLALAGPNDELKELGDTFDGLLARLETAFESQRRFVANASHELRTPITLERALVEVALADPNASTASLRETCERVLVATEQQERLIEALLTLARSQRGLELREQFDLGALTGEVVRGVPANGIRIASQLSDAPASGDPALVERLVGNLLDNALHYNVEHGWVRAWTGVRDGQPTLEVSNSGPVIAPDQVAQLTEPFRRLNGERDENAGGHRGLGLGLSIVDAIAGAHGARLTARPRERGGLTVEVRFPAAVS